MAVSLQNANKAVVAQKCKKNKQKNVLNVSVWLVQWFFWTVQKLFLQSSQWMHHRQLGERKHLNEKVELINVSARRGLSQCSTHLDLDLEWNEIKMHLCNLNHKNVSVTKIFLWEHSHVLGNVLLWMSVWLRMQQIPKIILPSFHWLGYCSPPKRNADKCHLSCRRPAQGKVAIVNPAREINPEKLQTMMKTNPKLFVRLIVFPVPWS